MGVLIALCTDRVNLIANIPYKNNSQRNVFVSSAIFYLIISSPLEYIQVGSNYVNIDLNCKS